MKKMWKIILIGATVLTLLIQLVPAKRDNPPVTGDLEAPPEVKRILTTSCYDCHSHETVWPLYSRIAPVSWLIARDVNTGRSRLNFSQWDTYPENAREYLRTRIYHVVEESVMPPKQYLLIHSDAKVSVSDIEVLKSWSGE